MKKLKLIALAAILFSTFNVSAQTVTPCEACPPCEDCVDIPLTHTPIYSQSCFEHTTTWFLGGNNILPPPNYVFWGDFDPTSVLHDFDIGTCNEFPFMLKANNKRAVFITPNESYVGVGLNNSAPTAALDISGDQGSNHLKIYGDATGAIESSGSMSLYNQGWFEILNGSPGSASTQMAIHSTGIDVYNGTDFNVLNSSNNNAAFKVQSGSGKTSVGYQPNATNLAKLNVNVNGEDAIDVYDENTTGTLLEKINFRVKANGYVYAREVNVKLGAFPDYVFNKDYRLPSLENLEHYIQQNKHLPNVPTSKDIEVNGANLGELVKIQMEKIEELTLYVIELKKELESLKKKK